MKKQVDKDVKLRMWQLRRYSKASLVEYIARTHIGWPLFINYDFLRAIERRHQALELLRLLPKAKKLERWLTRNDAILRDGSTISFSGYGRRNSKRAWTTWNNYSRLSRKIRHLHFLIRGPVNLDAQPSSNPASGPRKAGKQ